MKYVVVHLHRLLEPEGDASTQSRPSEVQVIARESEGD
jgi:hypothetical protein